MRDKEAKKRLLIFSSVAAGISLVLLAIVYFAINFMAEVTTATTEAQKSKTPIVRYNFDKIKSTGLVTD